MTIRTLVLILACALFQTCSEQEDLLNQVFNYEQVVTIEQIIGFYDEFVLSNTDQSKTIEEAYLIFLKNLCPEIILKGDISPLIPSEKKRFAFCNTLDKKALSEIFFILDSAEVFNNEIKEWQKDAVPFYFSYNTNGLYTKLLEYLSIRNDFFKQYYQNFITSGEIGPTTYASLLIDYSKIDFSRKEERITFIVPFLFYNKTY
jgi:hypothetical protein